MKTDNVVAHCVREGRDNGFVGIKATGNEIHFYYPEFYHFENENFNRDDVLDILKTISIAKSKSSDLSDASVRCSQRDDNALMSYIWIIEDYIRCGIYMNEEKIYKTNQNGKINWKKTLLGQPVVSGGNVLYKDFVAEVKNPQNTILSEAYRYCARKSLRFLGWLYGVSHNAVEVLPNAHRMNNVYLSAVHEELSRTNDDKKRLRLEHMENVIVGLDEVDCNNSIVYGVDSYHYVFERMIDSIFGNVKADAYYPTFSWNLRYVKNKSRLPGVTIRPDTIMRGKNNSVYIIDSKFYRYGALDLTQTKGLPEAASIVKQITYGSYVKSVCPDNRVYNVFVLPYDSHGNNGELTQNAPIVYVGNASSDWEGDKCYGKIHTFLIDLKYVVKSWNKGKHTFDREFLENEIEKESF